MTRETSHEAYKKIKENGLLSKRRLEVYAALFHHGPITASELAEMLPKKISRTIGSNVHARLAELRESGCAKEIRERKCSVSGMTVIEWDVTCKLPVKIMKPDRIKCTYCNGKGYSEQQRMF